jgi:hypothetical protein
VLNTQVNVVYQTSTEPAKNQTKLVVALQQAYQKPISVVSTSIEKLPSNNLIWDPKIIFYVPQPTKAEPISIGLIAGVVVAILVIVGVSVIVMVYYSQRAEASSAKPTEQRQINVKLHFR